MEEINPLNELHAERIGKETTRIIFLILGIAVLAFITYQVLIRPREDDDPKP